MQVGDKVTIHPESRWAYYMPEHVEKNPGTVTAINEGRKGTTVNVVFEDEYFKYSLALTASDVEPWEEAHEDIA